MSSTALVGPLVRTFPIPRGYGDRTSVDFPQFALPFCWSRAGTYTHRVRFTVRFLDSPHHDPHRPVASPWCGSSGSGLLAAEPDPDRIICGTCHGRAIGAGQIDDEGTPLIFTPQQMTDLGRCVYLVGSGGAYYFGYSPCHRQAVEPIDEAPGVGVCAEHAKRWPPAHRWRRRDNIDYAREEAERRRPRIVRSGFARLAAADLTADFWSQPDPDPSPFHRLTDVDPEEFWT